MGFESFRASIWCARWDSESAERAEQDGESTYTVIYTYTIIYASVAVLNIGKQVRGSGCNGRWFTRFKVWMLIHTKEDAIRNLYKKIDENETGDVRALVLARH